MTENARNATPPPTGTLALIVGRLRNSFALDYETARDSAEDVMVNFLALSRSARTCADEQDFVRASEIAGAVCVLGENLALPDLADAGRAYAASVEAENLAELQVTTKRLVGILSTFGIEDITLEQHQLEDEA